MRKTLLASIAVLAALSITTANAADKKKAAPKKAKPVAAAAAPVVAAPKAYSWTGVYAGVNAGYSFGQKTASTRLDGTNPQTHKDINGFIAGGQIGYDYQLNSAVVGIVSDYNVSQASKNYPGTNNNFKGSSTYVATLRGRVGYAFNDKVLAYATTGIAFTNTKSVFTQPGVYISQSASLTGYVVGGGVEFKATENISTFAEYRYYNYSKANLNQLNLRFKSDNSEVRAGINYRF